MVSGFDSPASDGGDKWFSFLIICVMAPQPCLLICTCHFCLFFFLENGIKSVATPGNLGSGLSLPSAISLFHKAVPEFPDGHGEKVC